MAAELQIDHITGKTVYFLIRNAVGAIWNGSAFEAYATANYANYDVVATEQGTASAYYVATMPVATAGTYSIVAKEQAGGSPAETDLSIGNETFYWAGTVTTVPYTSGQVVPLLSGQEFVALPKAALSGVIANSGLFATVPIATISGVIANSGLNVIADVQRFGGLVGAFQSGMPDVRLGVINHAGSGATLELAGGTATQGALHVTNYAGPAVRFIASGTTIAHAGLDVRGNVGLDVRGRSGNGFTLVGVQAGLAINAGGAAGNAIEAAGAGTGNGLFVFGGATGVAVLVGDGNGEDAIHLDGMVHFNSGIVARVISGSLTGTVGGVASGTLTQNSYSSGFINEVLPNATWSLSGAIESGLNPRQATRLVAAACAGVLSGAGTTTVTIANPVADFKARITATVDSSGNRTAITWDAN